MESQNNVIWTYFIKVNVDNRRENNKYRLFDERKETVNNRISEYRKLAKKISRIKMNAWEI